MRKVFAMSGLSIALLTGGCGESDLDSRGTCAADALVRPTLEAPLMWEVVDTLRPVLSWSYPDPSCEPDNYSVTLYVDPFFDNQLGGFTGDSFTSWTPVEDLQPGTEYTWGVRPFADNEPGPPQALQHFFTGPFCAPGSLVAPDLLKPADDEVVDRLVPLLYWDYPDPCLARSYRIDLSTNADFDDSSLFGSTGSPANAWAPGQRLTDCTRYYWRVAGGDGERLGSYSEVRTFRVDTTGSCPDIPL